MSGTVCRPWSRAQHAHLGCGSIIEGKHHLDLTMHLTCNDLQFPIVNSTHHLLPSPHGELAPAIEAVLDVYGTQVVVVIAHNGQGEMTFVFMVSD